MSEEHPLIVLAREHAPSQFTPGVRATTAWMSHPSNRNHGIRVIDHPAVAKGPSVSVRPPLPIDRVRLASGMPLRLVIDLPPTADPQLDAILDGIIVSEAETSVEDTLLRLRR